MMDTSHSNSRPLHPSCPACAGVNLRHLWEVNGYNLARCDGCTLVFVRDVVTAAELDHHYSLGSDDAYAATNRDCLNFYYHKLRKLIESRIPQKGALLDVGCSAGWFLDVMHGWECHGNEIVDADADLARSRYGDRIVTGSFEAYPERDGYFDVITMQDVFDHFRDPVPALDKCRRMLRPGGLLVIKVHNISCLYAKATGKSFYAIIPPSHLFYYNRKSLTGLLNSSGFKTVDSRFIAHILRLRTVFSRLARNNQQSIFYSICKAIDGTPLGDVKIRKNLHDIITVLAVKQ